MSSNESWWSRLLSAITGRGGHVTSDSKIKPMPPDLAWRQETRNNFEFFNSLNGRLEVEISKPAERVGNLLNEFAPEDAEVLGVKLHAEVYEEEANTFRPLTEHELNLVVFESESIRLRGESGGAVEHWAPNGQWFTVGDLIRAVEATEMKTRGDTEWFGGVDVHHCYFEGLEREPDGPWAICWGS